MKLVKAIRPIPVGERNFLPGEYVTGLEGKDLEQARADGKVVLVTRKKKKVRRGNG